LHLFEERKGRGYRAKSGLSRLLVELDLKGKKIQEQCVEAALIGFISEKILRLGQVLLSDRAGQFAILNHAACWVHMERPLRKLVVSKEGNRRRVKPSEGSYLGCIPST